MEKMRNKTIGIRAGVAALLTLGGFAFPILFLPALLVSWTIYESLANPSPPDPDAWFTRRWTATGNDPEWKSYFLRVCESPAETAFVEAMISAYGLLPEKGILKGSRLSLSLQFEIKPYRLDFLADGWLVIEIDGAAYHSSPEAVARDRERDQFLEGRGYDVLRIPAKVVFAEPSRAVESVRSAIAAGRKQADVATPDQEQSSPAWSIGSSLAAASWFVSDLNSHVAKASAAQEATRQTELTFIAEQNAIRMSFDHASSKIHVDAYRAQSENHKRSYDQVHERYSRLLREPDKKPFKITIEKIISPSIHADSEINKAIQEAHINIMEGRQKYFEGIRLKLKADPRLAELVRDKLIEIGCPECWDHIA